jgi:hypothetical protein
MDRYREIIKSLIKKQEEKLAKINKTLFEKEIDRDRVCLKADYLDGGTFKISTIEDNLIPKTDSRIEDDKEVRNKNEIALKKMGVHKFKVMLETDFEKGYITERQYKRLKMELEVGNLEFQYGLYTAFLIMTSED